MAGDFSYGSTHMNAVERRYKTDFSEPAHISEGADRYIQHLLGRGGVVRPSEDEFVNRGNAGEQNHHKHWINKLMWVVGSAFAVVMSILGIRKGLAASAAKAAKRVVTHK